MDKTTHILRGLLNLRIYNRVFTSKYCVSRKDSGEKGGTSSETKEKSAAQKNKISENENKAGDTKHGDKRELSSNSEITVNDQSTDSSDFRLVDEKTETVKSERNSDVSSSSSSTSSDLLSGKEKTLGSKLEKLIHMSEVYLKTDSDIKDELQSYKEKFATQNVDSQTSKLGVSDSSYSFASLLRKSAFIDLGDPVNKLVVGQIYLTVDNDLYIDFGWKFPAICPRPKVNPEVYNIGAKVLLRIKDLELTARFLGDKEYTSLLEADCVIIHRINEDGSKYVKFNPEKPQAIPD